MIFNAVLFDLDYTLYDSETSERDALNLTLFENGITPTQTTIEDYKAINLALWNMLEKEKIDLEYLRVNRFEQLLDKMNERKDGTHRKRKGKKKRKNIKMKRQSS